MTAIAIDLTQTQQDAQYSDLKKLCSALKGSGQADMIRAGGLHENVRKRLIADGICTAIESKTEKKLVGKARSIHMTTTFTFA